ncbi:glutaredoxin family protein [Methyloglobulus sp.]|uniref:glutaredoxin family protein n=1 Tax=Methyloglobulus sp. TaxID=2518622 RepID=UPI0032B6FBAF
MSKTTFLLLIALVGGLLQNQSKIKHWLHPPPPRTPGNDKVILYSTTWCGYCAKTRKYFADNGIDYQDIDVEQTDEGRTTYQQMGANGVPIIVINNDTIIRGYDIDEIDTALGVQ